MNYQISLIPELNYWMIQVIKNSPVYETFHKIPSHVSEYWREPNSILELLFNENFDPDPMSSSSSSSLTDLIYNDKRYIYQYRRCNLLRIPQDSNILKRIQIYRWNANVFVANSEQFLIILDMTGSMYGQSEPENPTVLPYDVNEEDRSPYITYETDKYFTTNYPLVKTDPDRQIELPDDPPILTPAENIFDLTDQDHRMLDLLYDFKIGLDVTLDGIDFSELDTCLSKLIYIYLDAFINDSYSYYNNEDTISDGTNILCTLYEKYVLDMIYHLKQKRYGVIWKDQEIINTSIEEIQENYFIILKRERRKITLTPEILLAGEFILSDDVLPWHRKDMTIFRDGEILEQDEDFTVQIVYDDPNNIYVKIILLKDIFQLDEELELIWSFAEPYSVYSEEDQ